MEQQIIADLHIHSRFSRACSKDLTIPNLVKWARIKGINLLGTGDFTHPTWLQEIKELNDNHYKLKNEIEINQKNYEKLIDETADQISSFVEKANL